MKDDIKRTPLEEAGIWVGRVSRRRFQLCETLLEQMGVGPGQVPILTELDYHGEMTQRELAEAYPRDCRNDFRHAQTKRMEKAGIVSRSDDNRDARVSIVRLTEKGKVVACQACQQFRRTDSFMMDGFTDEECETLVGYLERMRENINSAMEKINRGEE